MPKPSIPSLRRLALVGVALAIVASVAPAAEAQTTVHGRTAGGAHYTISVPEPWNGELVIWNHGFDLSDPEPEPDLGPLASVQLAEGFAVAASSYRTAGWATFKIVKDLRALVQAFRASFGEPEAVYLTGGSFGGLVSVQAVEKGGVGNVAGVLALCAPLAGSRNWDAGIDLRLSYDVVCGDVEGAALPGGATGLPAGSDLDSDAVSDAVNACTGVSKPRGQRTGAQKARLRQLLDNLGIDESFLITDMTFATLGLADLTHDRGKLRGRQGVGNENVSYRDPVIDAAIERVRPNRGAERRLQRFYTPTGRTRGAPVMALYTDKDDLVVVENLTEYAARAEAERLVSAVVVEKVPSHCVFSPAEVAAGWESLVAWSNGAPQPSVADLQSSCTALAGVFGLEAICRFDEDFEAGPLDERIPPRD